MAIRSAADTIGNRAHFLLPEHSPQATLAERRTAASRDQRQRGEAPSHAELRRAVQSNRSPYDQLAALFTTRLQALTDWAGSLAPGEQRFRSLRIPVFDEEHMDEDGVARPLPLEPEPVELH